MKRNVVVYLVAFLALSSCKKVCDYRQPIEDLFVTNWDSLPVPNRGKVYSFKAGTHFTELIDSFNLPIIERIHGYPDWISFTLRGKMPTHKDDIRLVLDDTLVYDISNITLSWYVNYRQRGMTCPREYCIVSSLKVNGYVVKDTTHSGYLAFPREYARILKR